MEIFVTYLKDIKGRIDPDYYDPKVTSLKEKLRDAYSVSKFGEFIEDIYRYPTFYGFEYQDSGIPVIKGENIDEFGIIEHNQEFDYITQEIHEHFQRTRLKKNDLLFTVRGVIGKVGLFDGFSPEANINANLIKITIKQNYNPEYFWLFLNSSIGQTLIQNVTSGQVQKTITVQDIKDLLVPMPPVKIQNQVVDIMESAYQLRIQKGLEAQELLDSINHYITSKIGLKIETPEAESSYIVLAGSIEERLDAHFYRPLFRELEDKLININSLRLGDIITFSKEIWNQKEFGDTRFPYIEISGVDIFTGEIKNVQYIDVTEAPSRARIIVRENDIIVSTTRPNRGAIAFIDHSKDGFIASTGFAVLREMKSKDIDRHFLFHFLRTDLCLKQMLQRSSGGNYPAIIESELRKILIPIPPLQAQQKIVEEVSKRVERVKEYQLQAKSEVEKAKAEVEHLILRVV